MKILHVIPHVWIGNGAAKLMYSLLEYQKKYAYTVDLISLEDRVPSLSESIISLGCDYKIISKSKYNPISILKLMYLYGSMI